jgi:hypothetical protein
MLNLKDWATMYNTELSNTLNYAAPYWATQHPLSYAAPYWATVYPTELAINLSATLHPTELRCTPLS